MGIRQAGLGLLPAVVLLGVAGCAGIGDRFQEPDLEVQRVIVRGMGLTGGTLDVVLDVDNPNDFGVEGTELRLGLDVDESHVGDATLDDEFRIEKNATTTLTIPVRFNWTGVGGAFRSVLGYGDIPYTIKGEATLQTPWGRRVVPFTKEGRAPLTRSSGGT